MRLSGARARIIHRGSDYPCPPDRRPLASSCADPGRSTIQHPLGRDLHGSRSQGTSSHRERSYPQVVSTGLCRVVWVLGMSPLPLCTRPIRDLQLGRAIPLGTSHKPGGGPWGIIAIDRVLAEKTGKPADQSGPVREIPTTTTSAAATAHSSVSCNSSVTTPRVAGQ